MGEYFKLWRRKIGVVTLLMACVFMVGWLRSLMIADWIEGSKFKVISFDGGVCWEHTENLHEFMRKLSISTASAESVHDEYRFSSRPARWTQNLLGFGRKTYGGESRQFGGIVYTSAFSVYRVPYWSLSIPLIFISAFLLLSHRRQSTRKKLIEPTTAEGA